jgi:hypothetical protein
MASYDLTKINDEILIYSLQPQRFSKLVKLIRKILWRFIRPFHFYQITEFYKMYERQTHEVQQMHQKQDEKIKKFFTSAASAKSDLTFSVRSESIPLMNRIAYLESENESLKMSLKEIKKYLKINSLIE